MRRTPVSQIKKSCSAPSILKEIEGGGRGGLGGVSRGSPLRTNVSNGGSREGVGPPKSGVSRTNRREATPIFILFYFLFLLYYLRTTNGAPTSEAARADMPCRFRLGVTHPSASLRSATPKPPYPSHGSKIRGGAATAGNNLVKSPDTVGGWRG